MGKQASLRRHPTNDGEYLTRNGWRIYLSLDDRRWHIVNPETGGNFDSADTLRELRSRYA